MRTASFGLAILYALVLTVSALSLGIVVYWYVQTSLERQMISRIDAEFDLLQEELRSEGLQELITEVQERTQYFHALEYSVVDPNGNTLVGNLPVAAAGADWADVTLPPNRLGGTGRTFKVRSTTLDDGVRLSVGDDLRPMEEIKDAFLQALGWALAGFVVLSVAGGLLLSRAFLQRLDTITLTAEAIIGGNLRSRVPLRGTNDNFDRLSATLNQMLDRIHVLMESLSQVSADIAHALRTPLGRLGQKLEVARSRATPNSECERAIDAAFSETEHILETFSALLRIAELEAATRSAGFAEVDLSKLFERVAEAYVPVAEDQGKEIAVKIAPSIKAWGDKDLLTEMLANLLDNAITHTAAGSHIEVCLTNGLNQVMASVADDGPGIPCEERARIFKPFVRLERSLHTPGSGLGLSLVAAVADLHSVKLIAEDNHPGLRMTMEFETLHDSCDANG
jgi:signal transduction histidine kinase